MTGSPFLDNSLEQSYTGDSPECLKTLHIPFFHQKDFRLVHLFLLGGSGLVKAYDNKKISPLALQSSSIPRTIHGCLAKKESQLRIPVSGRDALNQALTAASVHRHR